MADINDYKDTDTLRYSNVSFLNRATIPQLAKATETRTSSLLQKPSDWKMSVIRFDIDSQTLPINVPLMQNYPTSNATQSIVTLESKGVYYSTTIQYFQGSSLPIYNFLTIYNYQDWLRSVNLALASSFTDSKIAGNPPLFIYDAKTGLIDLFVDNNFVPIGGVAPLINIFMNRQLFDYFKNFKNQYQLINSTNPLLQYMIEVNGDNALLLPAVGSRQGLPFNVQTGYTDLYVITDSAPSTAGWSSVRSLILSSGSLPFRVETIPNLNNTSTYYSDNDFPILSDCLVRVESKVTDFRVVNEYLPTAQFRYLDLLSDTPLVKIDLLFYWTDFTGNIYPLYILPQKSFSVKLLFERREKKKY